ncbi:hypothetical protein F5Y04DRAFT_281318 [Hypomontagnella monticulosa]|nr:hypothetical protein F5Y04DRAFT_281318 [Hypomontagnella monticulosa]
MVEEEWSGQNLEPEQTTLDGEDFLEGIDFDPDFSDEAWTKALHDHTFEQPPLATPDDANANAGFHGLTLPPTPGASSEPPQVINPSLLSNDAANTDINLQLGSIDWNNAGNGGAGQAAYNSINHQAVASNMLQVMPNGMNQAMQNGVPYNHSPMDMNFLQSNVPMMPAPYQYQQYPYQYPPPPQFSPSAPPMNVGYPPPQLMAGPQYPVPLGMSSSSSGQFPLDPNQSQAPKCRFPSPIVIDDVPLVKRPATGPDGQKLRNDRIQRVTRKREHRPDPREWYGPSPAPPTPWGPARKDGRPLFRYTEQGELERGKFYTVSEMRRYLYGPKKDETNFTAPTRLPGVRTVHGKIRQGLTLWIGWVPPQANERYPHGTQSQKCRFADCGDQNHTIRTGFPRITFDERMNVDGEAVDVYHNAGYAHMYCFERHFDLVEVIQHLDVRLDEREFKRDENLGKLSRNFPEIRSAVDSWWQKEYPKWQHARRNGQKRNRHEYSESLGRSIIAHTVRNSGQTRCKMREERGGADISKHLGDLSYQRFLKDCMAQDLVDDKGDPLPGAKQRLEEIKGRKRGKMTRKRRPASISIPEASGWNYQPLNNNGFTGSLTGSPMDCSPQAIPMPTQQSSGQPYGYGYESMLSPSLVSPTSTLSDQSWVTATHSVASPSKRSIDEVMTDGEEEGQGSPPKKQRSESPIPIDPALMVERGQVPDQTNQQVQDVGGPEKPLSEDTEDDSLSYSYTSPSMDEDISELDINENDVFEIIDREIPEIPIRSVPKTINDRSTSGESSNNNVNGTTMPTIGLNEDDKQQQQAEIPGNTELGEGGDMGDLFGDSSIDEAGNTEQPTSPGVSSKEGTAPEAETTGGAGDS